MFSIDDAEHLDLGSRYPSFDLAIAEVVRRAALAWDEEPNRAPCREWRTCGRVYEVREYDDGVTPWRLLGRLKVVRVSAAGAAWVHGSAAAAARAWLAGTRD